MRPPWVCGCGTTSGDHRADCPDRVEQCACCGFEVHATELAYVEGAEVLGIGTGRLCESCVWAFTYLHCNLCGALLPRDLRGGDGGPCRNCVSELGVAHAIGF